MLSTTPVAINVASNLSEELIRVVLSNFVSNAFAYGLYCLSPHL